MQVDQISNASSTRGSDWSKRLFEGSWQLWLLYGIFLIISFLSVFSALSSEIYKSYSAGGGYAPILKHLIFLVAAGLLTILTSQLPPPWFRNKTLLYSAVVIGMIAALPILGKEINGAVRWIDVAGFSLQPSEFFKLCLILWGAITHTLSNDRLERANLYFGIYWGISGFFILIFMAENLSTGVLFGVFVAIYSIILRAPWRLLLKVGMPLAVVGVAFVAVLYFTPAQQLGKFHDRAITWQNRLHKIAKDDDEAKFVLNDADRQSQMGQIALANSRLLPHGPGSSKVRDSLPMAYSDFIYAIIVEEYGIFGLVLIPLLYVFWFYWAGRMAMQEKNRHRRALLLGIGLMFPLQALVNIAVVAGVFMTGQTLPLISYGGSSLMVCSIAMGMMLSISRVQNEVASLESEVASLEGGACA
ncbi:MAG: FtsW/RodA/SpoVE family cell cycle protein [Porphyromonadaceae bacterium]|nr:FtsW/RodA/SpoVE family cell cycle protein [Porphyromonadaceae bacterium]